MNVHAPILEFEKTEVLASVTGFRALPKSSLELLGRESECLRLSAGDVLFEEGDVDDALYIVASGTLQMVATLGSGCQQPLATFGPGDCVGETVALFHRPRQTTVHASTPAQVMKLSLSVLAMLFDRHPSVHKELRRLASQRLLSFHLASSPLLADLDMDSLRTLDAEANWIRLTGGEILFREGDPSDSLYLVVCGRLEITVSRAAGVPETLAHIGRGGWVGEMGLLNGAPRSATVRATRDTQLVRLSAEQFEFLVHRNPGCMKHIAKTLAAVVRRGGTPARKSRVATIALVPVQPDGLPARFVENLVQELSTLAGPAFGLSARRIDYDLGKGSSAAGDEIAHSRLTTWLAEYEEKFPCLLLECDPHLSSWTALCLRHSDLILFVAPSNAEPSLGPVETAIFNGEVSTSSTRKEMVLVHSDGTRLPSGTNRWLAGRKVDAHHHIRHECRSDYQRLARFIADKAVGVVLSGGGARGLAHVGALQAFEDCGVPVDYIGGTSIGAAIAGYRAMGVDMPTMNKIAAEFSNNFGKRVLRDLTFPAVALSSGRRSSAYLKSLFGDARIEDLWTPFFCTSSNLSKAEVAMHDEGLLWTSVRASSSIPGVWPPVVSNGHMLVDGGVMNNLPVDLMRTRCAGSVIGIDVSPTSDLATGAATRAELSGWPVLWKSLNPFAEKAEGPHIFSILSRASQLGSICNAENLKRAADLYISIPTAEVDLFDWKAAYKLIDVGYRHCRNAIEQWKTVR